MCVAKAVDVARYVLERRDARGRLTSVSALQELLYVCQAWMLVAKNRPLFSDEITAGERGPVVKAVALYCQGRRYVFPRDVTGGNTDASALVERTLVDRVLAMYDETDDQRLGDISHRESPWANAEPGATISLQRMLDYYSEIQANPNTAPATPIPNLADISDRTFISDEDAAWIGELLDDRTERKQA